MTSYPKDQVLRFFSVLNEKWREPIWRWSAIGGLFVVVAFGLWFGLSLRKSVLSPAAISGMTMVAETSDSLGVAKESTFLLRSAADISPQAVKDRLTVTPSVPFETRSRSAREVEVRFNESLKGGAVYAFKLATDAVSENAAHAAEQGDPGDVLSWAFQTKKVFGIEKTFPADKATSVPLASGIELTFTDEHFKNAEDRFQIEPAAKGRFETHRRTLVFVPEKLEPKTLYTVTMKAGVGVDGSADTLASDKVFRFETAAADARSDGDSKEIDFSSNWYSGMALYQFAPSATPAMSVSISGFETSSLDVSVYRFPDEDSYLSALRSEGSIPLWTRYARAQAGVDMGKLPKTMSFRANLESAGWKQYFLFPDTLPEGYYVIDAGAEGAHARGFIQMTDMAVYAAVSDTKTLVWANRTGTPGSPVIGATAEIILDGKHESLSGTTDEKGLLAVPTPASLKDDAIDQTAFMRVVSPDVKSIIVPVESNANYSSGASGRSEGYWSYLYLDRDMYQPTDTPAFWGVLRKRDASAPERTKLKIVIEGKEQMIETSEWGTFIGEIPIKEFPVGYYSVRVFLPGDDPETDTPLVTAGFSVETYTKPAYRITMHPEKAAIFQNDSARFVGTAEFFDGTPAVGVELSTGTGKPAVVTDAKGAFSFESRYSDLKEPTWKYESAMPVSAEEGDIEAGSSVAVFPSGVGLSFDETRDGLQEKIAVKTFETDLKKANQDGGKIMSGALLSDGTAYAGKAVPGAHIRAEVKEISYVRKETGESYDFIEKKKIKRYTYDREETNLPVQELTAGDDGTAVMTLSLENGKGYEATFETADPDGRKTEITRYFYGYSFNLGDPDYALFPKQEGDHDYHLNEEVSLEFGRTDDSAVPADSQFLFYRTQRGLRDETVQSDPSYSFSYAERDIPNVEVRGVMFTGKTYIERLVGFQFDRKDRALSLSVSAEKESYRPGDTVNVDVSVKDRDGKGRAAKVNLSAVDEAQLALAPHTPDLTTEWSGLYRSVGSGIIAAYASHQYPLLKDMAERGGCFLGGTPVTMADGSAKAIERVAVGDAVASRGSESDPTLRAGTVTKTWKHVVDGYLIVNGSLRVTAEHNIFSNGRWVMAGELRIGDSMLSSDNRWEKIRSIEKRDERVTVYNLSVETYHTYFADGVYVHNDKGRTVFLDRVLFTEVETDADGHGKTSFRVPDNLTSWNVASQAVTKDLSVGQSTDLSVPVSLPFFVVPVLNTEYVSGDKPVLSLRAFGTGIGKDDPVEFTVESDSLGIRKTVSGKAFEEADIHLPALPEGAHEITIGARSGEKTDKLTRTIRVVPQGTWRTETAVFPVAAGTTFRPGDHGRTTIIFGERGMTDALSSLWELSANGSGRFDGMVASAEAKRILSERFGEKFELPSSGDWQPFSDGAAGFKLLPYGDADLFTTALVPLADRAGMLPVSDAGILSDTIDNVASSRESVATALLGQAIRGDAVLLDVERLLAEKDLSVREKLLLGMAETALGNGERGKRILSDVLGTYERDAASISIPVGKPGSSEELESTALGALIASFTGSPSADQLYSFVASHISKENPLFLERMAYLESKLGQVSKQGTVSVSYDVNGRHEEKTIKRGETASMSLLFDEVRNLSITSVTGDVSATVVRTVAAKQGDESSLSGTLDRNYRVSDQDRHDFRAGDQVRVRFDLGIDPGATNAGGCLEVTDTLPAGMKPATSWRDVDASEDVGNLVYPYSVEGQRVRLCVPFGKKKVEYLARVSGKGDFSAPGTLVETDDGARFKVFPDARVTVR